MRGSPKRINNLIGRSWAPVIPATKLSLLGPRVMKGSCGASAEKEQCVSFPVKCVKLFLRRSADFRNQGKPYILQCVFTQIFG